MSNQLQTDLKTLVKGYMQYKLKDKSFVSQTINVVDTQIYFNELVNQVVWDIFKESLELKP